MLTVSSPGMPERINVTRVGVDLLRRMMCWRWPAVKKEYQRNQSSKSRQTHVNVTDVKPKLKEHRCQIGTWTRHHKLQVLGTPADGCSVILR